MAPEPPPEQRPPLNLKIVSRHLGVILLLVALAMLTCLVVGTLLPAGPERNADPALVGWAWSIGITACSAALLMLLGRRRKGQERSLRRRDAIGVVGMGWIACGLLGALPLYLCDTGLPFDEALFESVSGFTTTGATVFSDLEPLPKTVLLWRSLSQWVGGIGILAMFVLVLSDLGGSGKSLFQSESSAQASDMIGSSLRQTVRAVWILYIALTVTAAIGMLLFGMDVFQALNHALTTISTAGFGTENGSIDTFSSGLKLWITLLMIICAISFPLHIVLIRKREWAYLRRHEETWVFLSILFLAGTGIFLSRGFAGAFETGAGKEAIDTLFNTVSLATTTGYTVGDYDQWPVLAKGLLLGLAVVGGCSASTAGGLKVSRLILWYKITRIEIGRAFRPSEVRPLKINGAKIPLGTRGQLFVVLTSAMVVGAVSSLLMIALEPDHSHGSCVAAVIACLSNLGPAFADFGPTKHFGDLSVPSYFLLSLLMILGRLEYIALLVLFSKRLWRHY